MRTVGKRLDALEQLARDLHIRETRTRVERMAADGRLGPHQLDDFTARVIELTAGEVLSIV